MSNRKLLSKLVQKAVDQSFEKGKINESKTKNIVESFKKLDLNEAIFCLETYQKLLKQELSKSEATIYSATKLSIDEQKKLIKKLNSEFKIQSSEFKIDASLLGGIKVKIGDDIYDDTVKNKINTVREAIING